MQTTDVLVIGGGPAGSSCAGRLRKHGVDCLVLDRQQFPRLKLCAGWITPEVVSDLGMDISEYPLSFLTFEKTVVHFFGMTFRLKSPQHSIRRIEFDHWLLQCSGAKVVRHNVRQIRKVDGYYVVDDEFRAKFLVGAGGTQCPVYRNLFREANPRVKELQALALECEFPWDWGDNDCHLWFFNRGLPGYSWYVPKSRGYLNVGLGAIAHRLKSRKDDIKHHWTPFVDLLKKVFALSDEQIRPGGHSYFLRGRADINRIGNAFVVGDSAGLATRDLCEGIGPAIRSGAEAADSIALGTEFELSSIAELSLPKNLMGRYLEWRFCG